VRTGASQRRHSSAALGTRPGSATSASRCAGWRSSATVRCRSG
jgi:hypothetical protein